MYKFNKIKVNSQLPKKISRLEEVANNLWWSWNTDLLKLCKEIDIDVWESSNSNPVKFLKTVSQEKLEAVCDNQEIVKKYNKIVDNFDNYMKSNNTWFRKKYSNSEDTIAYFSAEYGLDQTLPIYSGGLGILSGDHLKSASDLGIPLVAVGLMYKRGYFNQVINGYGNQETHYQELDMDTVPINVVKDVDGKDLIICVEMPRKKLYLKVWKINVGRVELYLMDSDLEENIVEYRDITKNLYGGNQETRIQQEIVLGMAGVELLERLGMKPTVYHMNEGHSSFLILKLIENIVREKEVSFAMAKDIVASKTVFTTHTPVPAGNDIFPVDLMETYFHGYHEKLGVDKYEFLRMGMKPNDASENSFDMGILALKVAGKKNGVSKLHGEVSRELFAEAWPEIAANESPITYVTNGIHTCTWLSDNMKELYNQYLAPYWQDNIHDDKVWEKIDEIPNNELWDVHLYRKQKLINLIKKSTKNRLSRSGYSYEEINQITGSLDPEVLTIGFARRFATYKRATLLFRDLERITQLFSDTNKKIQIIVAGKAHPADGQGQDLIRYIHDMTMKPQFKGKIFLLENYNMEMSRHLISGVDVWLNTPRRPMEASGTSGQKASVNGVLNFSILDGWWAEGYNAKNGWAIGTHEEFDNEEIQDNVDSKYIYETLENKIIPAYYDKNEEGVSDKWLAYMKNSIISTGGRFSTSRMLVDYVQDLYMPVAELHNAYYTDLERVAGYNEWKKELVNSWSDIVITQQEDNADDITVDAGKEITVRCKVKLQNINPKNIEAQVYCGHVKANGEVKDISITNMTISDEDTGREKKEYTYEAKIKLQNSGEYGYSFRVMPKHEMLLDSANLNMIKWIKE